MPETTQDGTLIRLLDLSHSQLAAQLQAFASLDSKAGAVVGFDSIVAGLLFALNPPQEHPAWLFAVALGALGVSTVTGVLSMWLSRPLLGPNPEVFYELHGGEPETVVERRLLADMVDAVAANDWPLARKAAWWVVSATSLALAVVPILLLRVLGG